MTDNQLRSAINSVKRHQRSYYDQLKHPFGIWPFKNSASPHKKETNTEIVNRGLARIQPQTEADAEDMIGGQGKGRGRIQFPNGHLYEGELRNGRMHGQGTLQGQTFKYEGRFENGMKHGSKGTEDAKQYHYTGDWLFNKMHGKGILIDQNGRYEGNFEQGFKKGEGVLTYKDDGRMFRGQFVNNMPQSGEMILADGTRLDGDWLSGVNLSGRGTITYPNGDTYHGEWFQLQPHRGGSMTCRNGKKYIGEFYQGKRNGSGVMTFANGDKYEGQWKTDLRNGYGRLTFAKAGDFYEGEWQNDMMHGRGVLHQNGQTKEGIWEYGKPENDKSHDILIPQYTRVSTGDILANKTVYTNDYVMNHKSLTPTIIKPSTLKSAGLQSLSSSKLVPYQEPPVEQRFSTKSRSSSVRFQNAC